MFFVVYLLTFLLLTENEALIQIFVKRLHALWNIFFTFQTLLLNLIKMAYFHTLTC